MSRLTERDKQVIGRLYQGQLAESVAKELEISHSTISTGILKRLGTSVAGIRKLSREGTTLNNLLISLEGNGANIAPPSHHGYSVTDTIGTGFHREAPRQHRVQAGSQAMNYLQAIERENAIASLMKFDEFLAAFNALPKPTYDPYIRHPQQVEVVEGY